MTAKNNTSIFAKIFAIANYLASLLSLTAYFLVFLMPSTVYLDKLLPTHILPYVSLDQKSSSSLAVALLVDLTLILGFGVFHSLLARPRVKALLKMPASVERSFFLFQSNLFLVLQIVFWRNFDGPVLWNITNYEAAMYIVVAINVVGYLFLVTATFALDHFELFGLSQAIGSDLNAYFGLAVEGKLVQRWHYNIVAHPIMTGALVMLWATPLMTMPRFLVAVVLTLYIAIAVYRFEEPDLKAEHGTTYEKYIQSVPRFIPGMVCCSRKPIDEDEDPCDEEST